MANWKDWLNNDDSGKRYISKKPNKNIFCRKNRNGKEYGPHVYEHYRCIYCAKLQYKPNQMEENDLNEIKETANE